MVNTFQHQRHASIIQEKV